jgi:acyl-CoA dehydrogenase
LSALIAGAREGLQELRAATTSLLAAMSSSPTVAYAVSVPYLRLCGITLGGWLMARAARIAERQQSADAQFRRAKVQTANFYMAQTLPLALALSRTVRTGGTGVAAADADLL